MKCVRCGTGLNKKGLCRDKTCPFSDHKQTDPRGWAGHPEVDPRTKNDTYVVTTEDARRARKRRK